MSRLEERPSRGVTPDGGPALSVVVATTGPSRRLERTLRSVARLAPPGDAEVILGLYGEDGASPTRALALRYFPHSRVRIASLPRSSHRRAEAHAASFAAAPVIAFVTAGEEAPADLLEQAELALHDAPSETKVRIEPAGSRTPGSGHIVVIRPPRREAPVPRRSFAPLRPSRALRLLLVGNVLTAVAYAGWWLQPGNVGTLPLFAALAVVEGFSLLHVVGLWWTVWSTRIEPPPATRAARTIDVFVTTFGEPLDVIERTIAGAVGMRGGHRTFVLDDGARAEVEEIAHRHGATYLARPTARGAKAGNLNDALAVTDGELVCVFDADHVPRPDFLEQTLGYFEDDELAFVQTPQLYGNAETEEVARGAYRQQAIFYGPICSGKSDLNAAFCCGTNVVFRRRALADVGGFDERSVTEDFVTSMRIHARGWRSVYYPFALSEGLGPSTLGAYFSQQFRWARGSVGALATGEPFRRGLTVAQRLQYLLATTFYLVGLVTPVYIALPILYLVGGWSAFSPSSGDFVFYYAPYLAFGLVTLRWGLGGNLRLEHLRYTFGAFPVYALASLAALLHLPARFKVTGAAGRERSVPVLAWLSVAAFAATAGGIVSGLLLRPADPKTFTNVAWALVNLVLLGGIVHAVLGEVVSTARGAVAARLPRVELRAPHRLAPLVRRLAARPTLAGVGSLTALALVLRASLIDAQSLRLDESLSLREAQLPLGTMVQNLFTWDVHPPLYYTLLHGWLAVTGGSVFAARVPSVLLGTAAVPLLYLVARRLVGGRPALVAAALGAASPFWVWHSDEARMYPLFLATSLLALWLLMEAAEHGGRRRWASYGLAAAVSLYSHYFAALMLPVHLAYLLLLRAPRRRVAEWAVAAGLAVAALAPWLIVLAVHRGGVAAVGTIDTGLVAPARDHSVLGSAYAIVLFVLVYLIGYGQSLAGGAGLLGVVSRIVAGSWPLAAVFGALSHRFGPWLRSRTTLFLLSWLGLTIGVVFALDAWKHNVWLQRYLIVSSPAVFILAAAGLSTALRRRGLAVACVFAVFATATVVDNLDSGNQAREDWRSAASIVQRGMRPGDAVVVMPWFYTTPFDYYFDGRLPVVGLLSEQRGIVQTTRVDLPRLARRHRGHALWVVVAYESAFDATGSLRRELDRRFELTDTYRLGGEMRMRRYEVPSEPKSTLK